ncbi:MAG TPA: pilus assembly protein TadG-related protein [Candidatus Acidoferrales bacterium]|nr:pilus assembly protein TadG-related protein [Candidatus Acidoferrales bacterium]
MVLFAISLLVILVAVSFAIDGGFGLLQYRQAQNAADFAAEAAAKALFPQCTDGPVLLSSGNLIEDINAVVQPNSPSTALPNGWSAYYLNNLKKPLQQSGRDIFVASSTAPPVGACGVQINVSPQWPPFMAQIIGVTHLSTAAGAAAVNPAGGGGPQTSIVALAQNGAHTILDAGDGKFEVQGTIFDNSNGCLNYNANESYDNGHGCADWGGSATDIIDGKQSGIMYDWGDLEYSTIVPKPWDGCFYSTPGLGAASGQVPTTFPPSNPASGPAPTYQEKCTASVDGVSVNTNVYTDGWQSNGPQISPTSPDPIQASGTPTPQPSNAGCQLPTDGQIVHDPILPNTMDYYPGVYPNPVVINGNYNVVFENCSDAAGVTNANPPAPGIFYFAQGLVIAPPAGYTVNGQDVLFVTQAPVPNSAAPWGTNIGDGEPAIGNGSGNCTITTTGEVCNNAYPTGRRASYTCTSGPAGTNCNSDANGTCGNSVCFNENSVGAQGLNDSVEIGGGGTVNLSAPTDGLWAYFLVWQEKTVLDAPSGSGLTLNNRIQANVGMDAVLGDSAAINLTGVVYDNTDPAGQNPNAEQYWGGNASLPYLPGGMLVAGFGIATGTYGTGLTCGSGQPNTGGCKVTIDGLALVDAFQTQGVTQLAIDGTALHIPGIEGSAAILTN